ncbi:stage V sporulation protein AA [Paenibacillus swuensis]|uniref:Stage V sporulation protein AA n=1 Tax=Paenibacillus swuensis TaxID=1178515 RepID=A0A172TLV7_9BACL|nr:stage V sporulation protein AA [Paenibacillus swuensis]ANE48018.1 stage V sporulation protein AA [Paenibacillus swuensis]
MQATLPPTLYLRLRRRIRMLKGKPIRLGDIAQLLVDPELEELICNIILCTPSDKEGNLVLIDMLLVVSKVKAIQPRMQIEYYGEPHVLVELYTKQKPPNLFLFALVWVLLFFGSALAIMNFHADVSMMEVHQRIAELVTGKRAEHPYLLQIPYSLGIGVGMIIFFNHLFKRKLNEEPNPLEVEMFSYQESIHQFVVTEEYRKMNPPEDSP